MNEKKNYKWCVGHFPHGQWLKTQGPPTWGGPGSIPGYETRPDMPQLEKILSAASETQRSQNK